MMNTQLPKFSVPQNVQTILLAVAKEQAEDNSGQNQLNQSLLKTYWHRFKQARTDLSEAHETINHSSGDKAMMAARIQELLMRSLVQMAQKMTKSLALDVKKQGRLELDQAERITRLLEEVEASQSRIIEKSEPDAKCVATEPSASALAQVLQTTVAAQAESEKIIKVGNALGYDDVANQYLGQKGALEKQWSSLKKVKRLGKIFKTLTQIIMPMASAGIAVVMGPAFVGASLLKQLAAQGLQALVGGSLSFGTLLAMKPSQSQLSQAQNSEEELSLSTEQALERLSRMEEQTAQISLAENSIKNNIEALSRAT